VAAIRDGEEKDHKRQHRNKTNIHHRRSPPVNIVPLIVLSCAWAAGVAPELISPVSTY